MQAPPPKAHVTLRDVAKASGVSLDTAARVLRGETMGKRSDAVARADHILAQARRLGYRANAAARATRLGQLGAIGLFIPSDGRGSYLPQQLVSHAAQTAAARGFHLIVACPPSDDLADVQRSPQLLRELAVDGVVCTHFLQVPDAMRQRLATVPCQWVNDRLPSDCVHPDDRGMAESITRQLCGLGHRRIAWINFGNLQHYSARDRQEGWLGALRDEGGIGRELVGTWTSPDAALPDDRLARVHALLQDPDRPTAIVCYEQNEAVTVQLAAAELGVRIPEDLSVVCFHVAPVQIAGRAISTARVPIAACAAAAINRVADAIERHAVAPAAPLTVPYGAADLASIAAAPRDQASARARAPAGKTTRTNPGKPRKR